MGYTIFRHTHVVIPYLTLIGPNLHGEGSRSGFYGHTEPLESIHCCGDFLGMKQNFHTRGFRLTQKNARGWSTMWVKSLKFDRWMMLDDLSSRLGFFFFLNSLLQDEDEYN